MFILYLYILLGFINNNSITFYKNKYNLNNDTPNTINANSSTTINNEINISICGYIYQCIVVGLLLFNPLYNLIYNENINYIGFTLYKFNYVFQFLFLYFNFHKILKYKYLDNKYFTNILFFSQVLILIFYSFNIYLTYKFKFINETHSILIQILLNLSDLYGIFIYINSIELFILIFSKLAQNIYEVNKNIENNIAKNKKKGLIKIFYSVINLKNTVTYTISDFNYILNLFTITNLFCLGLLYHIYFELSYDCKIYFYILCGYFFIIEIICLSIILFISKTRQKIFSEIYNPLFINNFIKKYDLNTFNDNFDIELDINNMDINDITLYNILEENSTSIDWIILNITLHSKWVDFNLCGIEIYSLNCIAKISFIITLFYKIIQI